MMTAEGTIARRDGVTEIEADDMAALEAKVPDGYRYSPCAESERGPIASPNRSEGPYLLGAEARTVKICCSQ